jgi:hypothetical protein
MKKDLNILNIQGTFRGHSGDIQGTFREHSGNIQRCLSTPSLAASPPAPPGNTHGTFREHSGNIQGTFRELSGNIQGILSDDHPNLRQPHLGGGQRRGQKGVSEGGVQL